MMPDGKDIRFFPIFIGATMGVLLEVIATLVDEIVVGNLFSDEAFASVNLIEPYIQFEVFAAYLVTVTAFALMVVFVRVIKKEKLFDYSLMHLE